MRPLKTLSASASECVCVCARVCVRVCVCVYVVCCVFVLFYVVSATKLSSVVIVSSLLQMPRSLSSYLVQMPIAKFYAE